MTRRHPILRVALAATATLGLATNAWAQGMEVTNPRRSDEGGGPYHRLVIRGATMIDGTGAPPRGPVDIVVVGDRIAEIRSVGFPRLPIDERNRPAQGDREIDGTGMWVLPGLVDAHVHTGGPGKAPQAEYVYKLWMGNGITTVRGVPAGEFEWQLREKAQSLKNEIVAPRIFAYARPGSGEGWGGKPIDTPAAARAWVQWAAEQRIDGAGIDGVKLFALDPEIMEAVIDEAHKLKLETEAHLDQMGVARMNTITAARMGLDTQTHFYGLMESMLTQHSVQDWPLDYNYNDEQHRFGNVARLWYQAAEPGSQQWNDLVREFLDLGIAMEPTFTIYEASRDVMRAREAEWHDEYTLPSQWDYYQASRDAHGSYWYYWTSEDEYHWRRFYQKWMRFILDFNNAGGIVTAGSDAGFIYKLYGFDYIRELELLREAGLTPGEVIRAATMNGAKMLYEYSDTPPEFGILRAGLQADLILVGANPLENLKVLYGTGAPRLNDQTQQLERVGGVKYTIKAGIVYDAQKLLADVREMVRKQKAERNITDRGGA